jgi:hypothetical protein
MLTRKREEFLTKLADLCEQYNAGFFYTIDDDGVHISIDGDDIFVGHLMDPVTEMRVAAYNNQTKES